MTRYDSSSVYAYNMMLGGVPGRGERGLRGRPRALCIDRRDRRHDSRLTTDQTTGQRIPEPVQSAQLRRPGRHLVGAAERRHRHTLHGTGADGVYAGYAHDELPGQTSTTLRAATTAPRSCPTSLSARAKSANGRRIRLDGGRHHAPTSSTPRLRADWDITDNLNFRGDLFDWQQDQRQVVDFDGTEFLITTDDIQQHRENDTIELHLSGAAFNDRISWIAGYYSLEEDSTPHCSLGHVGVGDSTAVERSSTAPRRSRDLNVAAAEYVRQTALLLNLNGLIQPGSQTAATPAGVPSGGTMLTGAATTAGGSGAGNRYPWLFANISTDNLTNAWDDDEAWFGEATFGVTEKLDLTFGVRLSDKTGGDITVPADRCFPHADPAVRPQGDPFAGVVIEELNRSRQPTPIETYKFSAAYQATTDLMVYFTYAEGFTSAGEPLIDDRTHLRRACGLRAPLRRDRLRRGASCRPRSSRTPRSACAPTGSTAGCASTRRTSTPTGTGCA